MVDKEIIDIEAAPVEAVEEPALRCEIRSGVNENGSIYFQIVGPDQSLLTMEGLVQYARKELDRLWSKAIERNHQEG